jgi:large subunit ribosomal protein L22
MNKIELTAEQYSKIQPRYKKLPILTKKQKKELGIGKDLGKASVENIRVSVTKAALVLDLIRGKKLAEAKAICKSVPNKVSMFILKLLDSAEANAVNNNELDKNLLYVAETYADQGPTMKRIRPRAQGRTYRILKRTCHITLVLKEQK